MKHIIKDSFVKLLAHRYLLSLLIALFVFSVGVIIYIAVTIEAGDLKIITHYSAFGVTHFYRDSWVYLLSFIAFIILTLCLTVCIAIKVLGHDRAPLALSVGWLGIANVAITLITYIHLTKLV